ncbi:hypothetical protein [Sphaerisporangium dianthi]|uniref:hypothetical protein n=1 Tax=Sphaerisporangium dianthi TaxID=1436120 RepID=UPI0036D33C0F
MTIAILGITLLSGVVYSWMNRRANDALVSLAGDFPLTPEEAAQIAMEAGLTWRERATGRTVPVMRSGNVLKVEIGCRAGVMSFEVRETPTGSRVTGRAEEVTVVRMPELGGLGVSSTNVLYMRAGMPRNPARLLRRRERVFLALAYEARYGGLAVGAGERGQWVDAGRGRCEALPQP